MNRVENLKNDLSVVPVSGEIYMKLNDIFKVENYEISDILEDIYNINLTYRYMDFLDNYSDFCNILLIYKDKVKVGKKVVKSARYVLDEVKNYIKSIMLSDSFLSKFDIVGNIIVKYVPEEDVFKYNFNVELREFDYIIEKMKRHYFTAIRQTNVFMLKKFIEIDINYYIDNPLDYDELKRNIIVYFKNYKQDFKEELGNFIHE